MLSKLSSINGLNRNFTCPIKQIQRLCLKCLIYVIVIHELYITWDKHFCHFDK